VAVPLLPADDKRRARDIACVLDFARGGDSVESLRSLGDGPGGRPPDLPRGCAGAPCEFARTLLRDRRRRGCARRPQSSASARVAGFAFPGFARSCSGPPPEVRGGPTPRVSDMVHSSKPASVPGGSRSTALGEVGQRTGRRPEGVRERRVCDEFCCSVAIRQFPTKLGRS
jgi:hypothetical protein